MNEFNLPVHKSAVCDDDCVNTPKVASQDVTATCVIKHDEIYFRWQTQIGKI